MSHIFDALQRSEVEQAEGEPAFTEATFSVATELLEKAERKRRSAGSTAGAIVGSTPRESGGAAAAAAVGHADDFSQAENQPKNQRSNEADRFPSLPVSILPSSRLVAVGEEGSLGAEKFRFLAVKLRQFRQTRKLQKLLITSTIPQEGKSTVAANLACTLARRRPHRTLLIEGDLRRPTVAQRFGLGPMPGLCEWLRGETATENIYRLEGLGLWLLPAGSAPENPLELMQSGKLAQFMDNLSEWFDWVIIDSPPILPLADTSIWSRMADGILLVTRKGITEKRQLQRGMEAIERGKLLGALVNGSTDAAHSDYYQRYGPAVTSPGSPARSGK